VTTPFPLDGHYELAALKREKEMQPGAMPNILPLFMLLLGSV
jgi:hypothetical protein